MHSDTGEGDEMSATAAGAGAEAETEAEAGTPDARRHALFVLLRAELAAARARMLDSGSSPRAVSRLLDERISLLSADHPLATEPRTGSPHGHHSDDVQDLGDDPVECGGIGQ
jgi:hypothetical protein